MPRHHRLVTLALLPLSTLLAAPAWGWGCDHRADRSGHAETDGVARIVVEAKAGDLDVRGVPGSTVRATGVACSDRAGRLDLVRLEVERRGDTVFVRADLPESHGWNDGVWLDIALEVPADIALEIHDSSGDADVRGASARRIDDSSGDLRVRDNRVALVIGDSSGDLAVEGQRGELRIEDSSGDIRLADVHGTVTIEQDSSGDISIQHVSGSVVVERDSSGDIVVEHVAGDLVVQRDGSGEVSYRDVIGRVDVPRDKDHDEQDDEYGDDDWDARD